MATQADVLLARMAAQYAQAITPGPGPDQRGSQNIGTYEPTTNLNPKLPLSSVGRRGRAGGEGRSSGPAPRRQRHAANGTQDQKGAT
jgi:hypothetical protein